MPCQPRNLVLLCFLAQITSAGTVTTAQAQGLRINEVQVAGNLSPDSGFAPWVELVNTSTAEIKLQEFVLRTDARAWQLPAEVVAPGELRIVHSPAATDASGALFLDGDVVNISLVSTPSNEVVDSVTLPMAALDESFGRYPDGTGQFRVFFGRGCFLREPEQGHRVHQ